jgi:hypothetical protein
VRNAINNNPMVQIGLIAGLGLLVAVMLMTRMGGGSSASEEPVSDTATPEATATPAPASADPAVAPSPESVVPGATAGAEFEATKGLPAELVDSYRAGEIPVLFVLDDKDHDDRALIRQAVSANYPSGTAIFFAETGNGSKYKLGDDIEFLVPAANQNQFKSLPISKYSRVAEGVSLERTPAIIVLHPLDKPLGKGQSAPMPQASVSYGFRGKESITTAIKDALYDGKSKSYAP